MSDVMHWRHDVVADRVLKALKKNFFDAVYFPDAGKAAEYILGYAKPGMTVGFGGSMSVKGMGIQDKIKEKGALVLDHNAPGTSPEDAMTIRRKQLGCDLFITGTNALTMNGWLVNVDGLGNRVASMIFGPKKVIAVAGINKISKDLDAAFERIEQYAGPLNNKRLSKTNPCVTTGICMNCEGQSRICNVYSIMKRRPSATDITVVLVGENLGY